MRKELTTAVRTVMTNCTMVFHFLRFLNIVISFSEVIKSHTEDIISHTDLTDLTDFNMKKLVFICWESLQSEAPFLSVGSVGSV